MISKEYAIQLAEAIIIGRTGISEGQLYNVKQHRAYVDACLEYWTEQGFIDVEVGCEVEIQKTDAVCIFYKCTAPVGYLKIVDDVVSYYCEQHREEGSEII